ncbi:MAG: hypothetical protein FWH04_04665 [Oscillospiraceae bacterium]|nr:hypothetical protein [Oscillospiraceae bacterium]
MKSVLTTGRAMRRPGVLALAAALLLALLPAAPTVAPALGASGAGLNELVPRHGPNGRFLAPIEPLATATDSIPISNRAELEAIAGNLSGTYHLTADIDLAGRNWTPIGTYGTYGSHFGGVFDGQGHVIRNMTVMGEHTYAGLFGYVGGSDIKNVGLEGTAIASSSSSAGGIYGSAFGGASVTNCYNTGNVYAFSSGSSCAGGIAGIPAYSTISDCYNTGNVYASSSSTYAGGIAGHWAHSIVNCFNTGNVSASASGDSYAGGIFGSISKYGSGTANCYNAGYIFASSGTVSYAGGIGGLSEGHISDCWNTGDVYARYSGGGGSHVGGISGHANGTLDSYITSAPIIRSYNTGNIHGNGGATGGIAGSTVLAPIRSCYNTGDVSTEQNYSRSIGGICGVASDNSPINDCYNTGNLSVNFTYSTGPGGIIGGADDTSPIINCYNIGGLTVDAPSYVVDITMGGIASQQGASLSNCYWNTDSEQSFNGAPWEPKRGTGGDVDDDAIPLTSAQMKLQESFDGFDFDETWDIDPDINDGYPILRGLPNYGGYPRPVPPPGICNDDCIDRSATPDIIIPADGDAEPEINLTAETIDLAGFDVAEFSVNGGTKWKAAKDTFTNALKFSKLFNKGMTLHLKDAGGNTISFPAINPRPKPKLKVNYAIAADSGEFGGQWVLTEKNGTAAVKTDIQIGVAGPNAKGVENKGKAVDQDGWGRFLPGLENGVCVKPIGEKNGKPAVVKTVFFYRAAPSAEGGFTPGSAQKKVSVTSLLKPPKYKPGKSKAKADKTYVNGVLYAKKAELTLASGDQVWHGATAKKAASAKQTVG